MRPSLTRLHPLALCLSALALPGCYADDGYYDDSYYDDGYYPPECGTGVAESSIDAGQYLILDPGLVGATAEYLGDGAWRFAVACDTPVSGIACNWQLAVTPVDGEIARFSAEDLERDDRLDFSRANDGSVFFDAITDVDLDGFTLEATPGSTLEVSVALDGYCGMPFFVWLSDGDQLSASAATVALTPSAR